jgi:hypothetical protein
MDDAVYGLVPDAWEVDEPGTKEAVYELPLPGDDLSIRVYSTVVGDAARDRGDDAIRCVVWSARAGLVGGRVKTLRTPGWDDRLRNKIRDLYASWRDHDHGDCPRCGSRLVERRPKGSQDWDPFLACSAWDGGDGCQFTSDL